MTLSVPLLLSGLTEYPDSSLVSVQLSVLDIAISFRKTYPPPSSSRASCGREGKGEGESPTGVCGEILPGAQFQEDQRFSELLPSRHTWSDSLSLSCTAPFMCPVFSLSYRRIWFNWFSRYHVSITLLPRIPLSSWTPLLLQASTFDRSSSHWRKGISSSLGASSSWVQIATWRGKGHC